MTKIYLSRGHDPRVNLAYEEMLTKEAQEDDIILYLWQNDNTIVIGRNQNPHRECDLKRIEEDDVTLVRRLSGGGAVFHDLGNLNFTFIAHEKNYDQEKNFALVLDALKDFDLHGEFSGRNDLLLDGKKFSGNAFSRFHAMRVHHGTLMLDVDLTKMANYLTVHPLKMKAKGVTSVRSRVVNLYDLAPEMNVENLMESLMKSFEKIYGKADSVEVLSEDILEGKDYAQKYFTWEWNIGETPNFSVELEHRFDWGLIDLQMDLKGGKIDRAKFFTDALVDEDFQGLAEKLVGTPFTSEDIAKVFQEELKNQLISADLIEWIGSRGI